jgi:hypothetical protein
VLGSRGRDELATFLEGLDAQASRFVERRGEQRARAAARSDSDETPDIASGTSVAGSEGRAGVSGSSGRPVTAPGLHG